MEPPIQVEQSLSLGEAILILTSFGLKRFISLSRRSPKPLNKVEPPDKTMFWNRVFLRSKSDLIMELANISWMPSFSSPIRFGLNKSSGALQRHDPSYTTITTTKTLDTLIIKFRLNQKKKEKVFYFNCVSIWQSVN